MSLNEKLDVKWEKSGVDLDYTIDINGKSVKPYDVLLNAVNSWLSQMKEVATNNIEKPADKSLFNVAFNRIVNKIFPNLIKYLIPTIEFKGKRVISNKEISPSDFWKQAWPKVWQDFTLPERILIQKLTILSKDTNYNELIDTLAKNLSDGQPYSHYKKDISEQIGIFYDIIGKSFSEMFGGNKISLENKLITQLVSDLNSRIKGSKLEFQTNS
jgi:hypothetical protein